MTCLGQESPIVSFNAFKHSAINATTATNNPNMVVADALFAVTLRRLSEQGFSGLQEHNLHWVDQLMILPQLNWKDASKTILHYLGKIKYALDNDRPLPRENELLVDDCPRHIAKIYRSYEEVIERFRREYKRNDKITPSNDVLCAALMISIPAHIIENYPEAARVAEKKDMIKIVNAWLTAFFDHIGSVAENLPEHFNEIFSSFQKDCLNNLSQLSQESNGVALWLRLILLRVMSSDFLDIKSHYKAICADKANASVMYIAYKRLYLEQVEVDYEGANGRLDSLLGAEKEDQKKRCRILASAGSDAIAVYDFYLANPKLQKFMDKIAKQNLSSTDAQAAFFAIIQYYDLEQEHLKLLFDIAYSNSTIIPHLLKDDIFGVLQAEGAEFCYKLIAFLNSTKDPCCYIPVLNAISNEDIKKSSLMMDIMKQKLDHKHRVAIINYLDGLPESELPDVLSEELIKKTVPAKKKENIPLGPLSEASLGKAKRERKKFRLSTLNDAMRIFERHSCGRQFNLLIDMNGEGGEPVRHACEHVDKYIGSVFYLQFLHISKFRELYFKEILQSPEYVKEFEGRLVYFDNNGGLAIQEAELFRKWLESKKREFADDENDSPEPAESTTTSYKFQTPPAFNKILILAHTHRGVNLDEARIAQQIPRLQAENITVINAESLTRVRDIVKSLSDQRLILFMTDSASHSNYYALLSYLGPARRKNLYNVTGKRQLGELLNFLNKQIESRENISKMGL